MMTQRYLASAFSILLLLGVQSRAEVKVQVDYNDNDHAEAGFKFKNVPVPLRGDAGAKAKFTVIDGGRDGNGGDVNRLNDGHTPSEADQPGDNFFFSGDGGRILVDLGGPIDIKQVNSFSWHPAERGPQVYKLYASDGKASGFNAEPKRPTDPTTAGWKLVANVDTRPQSGGKGGQFGVSISDTMGSLGQYRYLLFDVSRSSAENPFGNTFYSEIDIVDRNAPQTPEAPLADAGVDVYQCEGGHDSFSINTAETPDLTDWTRKTLAPAVQKWYPILAKELPSPNYEAPRKFTIKFTNEYHGVAATGGTHIECDPTWYRHQLTGEGVGSVIHELVHVVQQYGRARRSNPNARTPGWLVEGIPDYLRWYQFEPQSHGAEISARGLARARYDGLYRISANFLNYVTEKYDKDLVPKLNAALRDGAYEDEYFKKLTGHTVQELNEEWRSALAAKLGVTLEAPAAPAAPQGAGLTDAEKAAGWVSLFDGKNFGTWHNFKQQGVRPGWQIKDGALVCADPHQAGDIVTTEKYGWFELQLDYNISEGGNSGIMFRVTDDGGAVWATGPEFQLEDNAKAADPQRCGWLYALYQPPIDPKTGKVLDATKPAGEWNHVRLLISPEKCVHEINGVKYFEYVLGSDDFKDRVAKSKFASMPGFAKADSGFIALQGDHGSVSFRNIKIRPIKPAGQ